QVPPRIEVEPATSAVFARPAVPGDAERLQAAAGELDQILLQGVDAERVLDLEIGEASVGAVGADEETAVALEECGLDPFVSEFRAIEVAEHRRAAGDLHGALMVRAAPRLVFGLVALPAGGGTRVGHLLRHGGGPRLRPAAARDRQREAGRDPPNAPDAAKAHLGTAKRRAGKFVSSNGASTRWDRRLRRRARVPGDLPCPAQRGRSEFDHVFFRFETDAERLSECVDLLLGRLLRLLRLLLGVSRG